MSVKTRVPILEEDLKILGLEKEGNSRNIIKAIREKLKLPVYVKQTKKAKILKKLGLSPNATQKEFMEALEKEILGEN